MSQSPPAAGHRGHRSRTHAFVGAQGERLRCRHRARRTAADRAPRAGGLRPARRRPGQLRCRHHGPPRPRARGCAPQGCAALRDHRRRIRSRAARTVRTRRDPTPFSAPTRCASCSPASRRTCASAANSIAPAPRRGRAANWCRSSRKSPRRSIPPRSTRSWCGASRRACGSRAARSCSRHRAIARAPWSRRTRTRTCATCASTLDKYPEITRALETGETVMVSDVDADPLYQDVLMTWGTQQTGARRTKSVIALPFALSGAAHRRLLPAHHRRRSAAQSPRSRLRRAGDRGRGDRAREGLRPGAWHRAAAGSCANLPTPIR